MNPGNAVGSSAMIKELTRENTSHWINRFICSTDPIIFSYITSSGLIATLKRGRDAKWAFSYLQELLCSNSPGTCFATESVEETLQRAMRPGRPPVYACDDADEFLHWATKISLERKPEEKAREIAKWVQHNTYPPTQIDFAKLEARAIAWLQQHQPEMLECEQSLSRIYRQGHDKPIHTYKIRSTPPMSKTLNFELIPTLDGKRLDDLSDDMLISIITSAEAEIERLSKIKTKSVMITNRAQKLQLNLDQLIDYLDNNRKSE